MTHSQFENILKGFNDPELPEIFHFEGTPSEAEFQKIFDFYSITLKNFSIYGIDPAVIYFNNRRSKNAFACKREKYSIVSFNSGTIIHLIQTFESILFETNKPNLDSLLDSDVNKLMYQLCLHFTLYHEMAHLIQKSSYLSNGLKELHQTDEKYEELRHLLELDADQFSSLCLGSHICDYLERIDPLKQNPELEEHVLVITIAALMLYILSFNSTKVNLYYKKYHHPHPSIRLSNIANIIVDYTCQARDGRSTNGKNKTKILVQAGKIVQNCTKSNVVQNYVNILVTNFDDIKNYIDSFILIGNKDTLLATDKWNEMAKLEG